MHTTTPASTQTVPDFDPGPLSWVQGEIGQALARGQDRLAAFRATPSDPGLLVQARNCIHQAAGAIQMVGLDAVVVYTDEIERQLARLAELSPPDIEPVCANIDRACRKLVLFLEELVGGAPPVPLKLFPEYEAMQRERGIKVTAATDLFFPAPRLRGPLPRRSRARPRREARGASAPAAPGLPKRPPHVPARRWRRRAQDARSGRGAGARQRHRNRKGCSGGPSARSSTPSSRADWNRALAQSSLPRGSTCRSDASSRARRRLPRVCGARCSITSP